MIEDGLFDGSGDQLEVLFNVELCVRVFERWVARKMVQVNRPQRFVMRLGGVVGEQCLEDLPSVDVFRVICEQPYRAEHPHHGIGRDFVLEPLFPCCIFELIQRVNAF